MNRNILTKRKAMAPKVVGFGYALNRERPIDTMAHYASGYHRTLKEAKAEFERAVADGIVSPKSRPRFFRLVMEPEEKQS